MQVLGIFLFLFSPEIMVYLSTSFNLIWKISHRQGQRFVSRVILDPNYHATKKSEVLVSLSTMFNNATQFCLRRLFFLYYVSFAHGILLSPSLWLRFQAITVWPAFYEFLVLTLVLVCAEKPICSFPSPFIGMLKSVFHFPVINVLLLWW